MERLWFITNPHSGSSDAKKAQAIEAACAERGLSFVGRTDFPDQAMPTVADLDRVGADTVVLFAGDGTINAASCALAAWDGGILILPGGTMNMLAKILHGNADPAAILEAAHEQEQRVALAYVEAGKHRALVGMIVGPAASWYRAREHVREGSLGQIWPAIRKAWRRTFGHGVHLTGAPGFPPRVQGAYIRAQDDHLQIAAVNARDAGAIADLGWNWVTGDWLAAQSVTEIRAQQVRIAERRPVLALFDGEPQMLDPGTTITVGRSRQQFITTVKEHA
jgi:diacylglycerol kinase family enzyme